MGDGWHETWNIKQRQSISNQGEIYTCLLLWNNEVMSSQWKQNYIRRSWGSDLALERKWNSEAITWGILQICKTEFWQFNKFLLKNICEGALFSRITSYKPAIY